MATGVPFEISLSINLNEKVAEEKTVNEEVQEETPTLDEQPVIEEKPKTRVRCLFKRRNK
jgi:hypothetical protein